MSNQEPTKAPQVGQSELTDGLEHSDHENDLFLHALNYRGASVENAEHAWQELKSCADRLIAVEREACAKECEDGFHEYGGDNWDWFSCASAIRERSNAMSVSGTGQLVADQPAAYEYRFFCGEDTVNPGCGTWERVEPRNTYTDTVGNRVCEIKEYIDMGQRYELRALYVGPMPSLPPPNAVSQSHDPTWV